MEQTYTQNAEEQIYIWTSLQMMTANFVRLYQWAMDLPIVRVVPD